MTDTPRGDRDKGVSSRLDADEEALRWDGETDSSHVAGPAVAGPVVAGPGAVSPPAKEPRTETSAFLLVTYGILAGMYGLYVIGWIVAINRTSIVLSDALPQLMFTVGQWLAIGSAPLWFGAVFVLSRKNTAIIRLLWLLVGLLPVAPWPAILGGA